MGTISLWIKALLDFFYGFTGNYGIAIVLLTLAIRVIILPLTLFGAKSMKRMQEVQPRIKRLQEKYGDDKERLNKEMMELYSREKINPMSGCLPTLIQLPILWALFAVLRDPASFAPTASEPWLWLSGGLFNPDPLYILPALTVVTMFLQSFLTNVSNDPSQRMMLYAMPLMFGFITFKMQAGVVLYWVVSQTFGLIQQAIYPGFPKRPQEGAAD